MITPGQIKAGRALISWSAPRLAIEAKISLSTLTRAERGRDVLASNLTAIEEALTRAGLEIIPDGAASFSGGAGVRSAQRGAGTR
jgi:transcriptional regulator with XRE-family HTH domain